MRRDRPAATKQPGSAREPVFGGSPQPRSDIGQAFRLTEDRPKSSISGASRAHLGNAGSEEQCRSQQRVPSGESRLEARYPEVPALVGLAAGQEVHGLSLPSLRALIEDAPAQDGLRALRARIEALPRIQPEKAP
jgi:hypothetical protein